METLSFKINIVAYKINTFLKWLNLYKLFARMVPTEQDEMIEFAKVIVARPL
jgi:hypothetical protein